jgi:hypothetical protein
MQFGAQRLRRLIAPRLTSPAKPCAVWLNWPARRCVMTDRLTPHLQALSNAFELLDALDSRLLNAHHLARTYADMTDSRRESVVQVDAAAIGGTMGFFADELATARASLKHVYRLVNDLCASE